MKSLHTTPKTLYICLQTNPLPFDCVQEFPTEKNINVYHHILHHYWHCHGHQLNHKHPTNQTEGAYTPQPPSDAISIHIASRICAKCGTQRATRETCSRAGCLRCIVSCLPRSVVCFQSFCLRFRFYSVDRPAF